MLEYFRLERFLSFFSIRISLFSFSVGFKQFAKKEALSKLSTIFKLERHFEKNEDLSGLVGLAGRRGLRT